MKARGIDARQAKQLLREWTNGINTITEDASREDKTGRWGLDSWIRVIHELVDLQVRTAAAVAQASVAGPWWLAPVDEGLEPEPYPVDPADFARNISVGEFTRVGQPATKIPPGALEATPPVLPAGERFVHLLLKDYTFVGANYAGTITLTNATDQTAEPHVVKVTLGL